MRFWINNQTGPAACRILKKPNRRATDDQQGGSYSEVVDRRKRHKKNSRQDAAYANSDLIIARRPQLNQRSRQLNSAPKSKLSNRSLIIGKKLQSSGSYNPFIPEAAKTWTEYVNKAIYCIDNVSLGTTVEDVKRYVTDLSLTLLSCFEFNPRRTAWQRKANVTPNDHRTFRVCIVIYFI